MASVERDTGAVDKARSPTGAREPERPVRQGEAPGHRLLAGLQQGGAPPGGGDDGLSTASTALGVLNAPPKSRQIDPRSLVALQRNAGNRATSRYVATRRPAPAPAFFDGAESIAGDQLGARDGRDGGPAGTDRVALQRQLGEEETEQEGESDELDTGLGDGMGGLFEPSTPELEEDDEPGGGEPESMVDSETDWDNLPRGRSMPGGGGFGYRHSPVIGQHRNRSNAVTSYRSRMSGQGSQRALNRHRRALGGGGGGGPLPGVGPRQGPRPLRQARPWQTERQERSSIRSMRRSNARSGRRAMNRDRQHRLASFREEVSAAPPEERAAMWRAKGGEFKRRYG